MRVLDVPVGPLASYGSTGASLLRALWEPGEEHASGTDHGLLAVVVQCRVPPVTSSEEAP